MVWQLKKLSEVCQIKPPKKEARQILKDTDLVSFLPMSDLGILSKEIYFKENKPLHQVSGSYTYFAENDVLLAKITPCFENGKLGIARGLTNGIGFGSSEYLVFRSKGEVEPEYLFYLFAQNSFRQAGARVMSGTSGHQRVPKDFIENYLIPLPPLSEQKRIVEILDEAFEGCDRAIANTEKNLANARELFESYLNGVVTQKGDGWFEKKFSEIGGKVFTGPFGSLLHKSDYVENGIPLVNPANIEGELIYPDTKKTVTSDALERLKNYVLRENDIVIGRRGEIGRCAVIQKEQDGWLCGTGCFFIKTYENTNPIFLTHLIRSEPYRRKLEALSTGATMKNLNNKALSNLLIALPPKEVQNTLIGYLNNLSQETQRIEAIYQCKLAALQELKQSILHQAFTGELTNPTIKEAVA